MSASSSIDILPRVSPFFTGRKREIEKIQEIFPKLNFFIICGMPGIGKTTFGLYLANSFEKKEEYKGNILWVKCKEDWQMENLFYEISQWFIKKGDESFQFFLKERPEKTEDIMKYLITLLNEKSFILFIDDFHLLQTQFKKEMIRIIKEYLKLSKIFILTREKFKFSPLERLEIFELHLSGLDKDDALCLVRNLLSVHYLEKFPKEEFLKELIQRVAGHPLLLKLFSSLTIAGALSPEIWTKDLSLPEDVEFFFSSQVFKSLSEKEREVLKICSLPRIHLSSDGIAFLLSETSLPYLETLKEKFLLEEEVKGKYLVHPLFKEYLQKNMDERKKVNLHRKWGEYFKNLWKDKEDILMARESFYHYFKAKALKESIEILSDAASRLCSLGYYEQLLHDIGILSSLNLSLPSHLLIMKANVLSILGRWKESLDLLKKLEIEVSGKKDLAEVLSSMAGTYLNTGQLNKALEFYKKALRLFRVEKNVAGTIKSLNYLSFIHGFRSESKIAMKYCKESMKLSEESKNEAGIAHALRMMGTILISEKKWEEAYKISERCLEMAKNISSARLTSWALYNLASSLTFLGEWDKANLYFEKTLEIGKKFSDTQVMAFAFLGLAELYFEIGDLDKAKEKLFEASHNFQIQGNFWGKAITSFHLGKIYLEEEKKDEALKAFKESLEVASRMGHIRLELESKEKIAFCYILRDDLQKSEEMCTKLLENIKDSSMNDLIFEIYLTLAEILFKKRETEKMKEIIDLAKDLAKDEKIESAKLYYLMNKFLPDKNDIKKEWEFLALERAKNMRGSQKREILKFFQHLDEVSSLKFRVKTKDEDFITTQEKVNEIRKRKEKFDLWIDIPCREFIEKDKGRINIFKKRILLSILLLLVRNAGKSFSPQEIFQRIWGFEYDTYTSPGEIRKNIARLRDLIEPERENPKYIKLRESFLLEKGQYYFEKTTNFCLIDEV